MEYAVKPMGPSAERYIREVLADAHTFGLGLLVEDGLTVGAPSALLPDSLEPTEEWVLREDHGLSREDSLQAVLKLLKQYSAERPTALMILENRYALPADGCLQSRRSKVVFHGQEVYHITFGCSGRWNLAYEALKEADSSMRLVGGVCSMALPLPKYESGKIGPSELCDLTHSCDFALVEAFDGTGFLVAPVTNVDREVSLQLQMRVLEEIAGDWDRSNPHGVDLRRCLRVPVRQRYAHVVTGRESEYLWRVLEERPNGPSGYEVVYSEDDEAFGLAACTADGGVFLGIYGSFLETLDGM